MLKREREKNGVSVKYGPISRGLITYINLQSPKDRREKRQKKNFEERAKQLFDK